MNIIKYILNKKFIYLSDNIYIMYKFLNEETLIECFIIGIISSIFCVLSYIIIQNNKLNKLNKSNKSNISIICELIKNYNVLKNILMCFICGIFIHLIIKKTNLTKKYCTKICYDDKCWNVCPTFN